VWREYRGAVYAAAHLSHRSSSSLLRMTYIGALGDGAATSVPARRTPSAPTTRSTSGTVTDATAPLHAWWRALAHRLHTMRMHSPGDASTTQLRWRLLMCAAFVPLALVVARRLLRRTRAELLAGRPPSFWASSLTPPHHAPAHYLPPGVWCTQLAYAILPVRVVRHLRDTGALRSLVDAATLLGGGMILAVNPALRRIFNDRGEGRPAATAVRDAVEVSTPDATAASAADTSSPSARRIPASSRTRAYDVVYGAHPKQRMDLFFSHRSTTTAPLSPVIVFVHGGAWGSGDKLVYRLFCTQLASRLGAVVAALGYRLRWRCEEDHTDGTLFWCTCRRTIHAPYRGIIIEAPCERDAGEARTCVHRISGPIRPRGPLSLRGDERRT
jgi:hypothetical protein